MARRSANRRNARYALVVYWTIVTTLFAAGAALYVTHRDRRDRLPQPAWLVPPVLALLPPALAAVGELLMMSFHQGSMLARDLAAADTYRAATNSLELALLSSGLIATLCMVLIAFGRSGDGRSVSWTRAVFGLAGIVVLGVVSPLLAAWVVPLVVLGIAAHALPTGRSVVPRRRTLAVVGGWAVLAVNAAMVLHDVSDPHSWSVTGTLQWSVQVIPLLAIASCVLGIGLAWSIIQRDE